MNETAEMNVIQERNYSMQMYIDNYNKRLRIDDMTGNIGLVMEMAEKHAKKNGAEKLIIKARKEDYHHLLEKGFLCEAKIDRYFLGSDLYFFCKYYQGERRNSNHWLKEDDLMESVLKLDRNNEVDHIPPEYRLEKIQETDVEKLAALYKKVFQVYPTPLHDPNYIKQTMEEGTIYYGFMYEGECVSAASAEVNSFYKNAELTDCATLIEHRKHGLMKVLLQRLEDELKDHGIYCAYSIARALSFGMNRVLHQLGYDYRGRLLNNCYIFDKLEDMNVWVKNLVNS
ncbi:putative beta-lysine N-acetyltransferase [Cytobacillus purgationiresistens]|uniref:Beta-lysine N-acetyltransferase n=1 Tax=Cytobacillus purgationiresistens TaxID=863449 RepID=A0ABU0AL34_9BACI|nr:putative beta-lysine N-acetyltransferase [Cytobacillus purgationiresistens]MDQ0271981.1 putative beta-lysine N-acetyltransferase [Cytobacillus purgationiresistens]